MVLDQQRGPGAHAPWAPCTGSPTTPLSKLLDWKVPQDPHFGSFTCTLAGQSFPLPCCQEGPQESGTLRPSVPEGVGTPSRPFSPPPTPGRKPLTWMLSKEALLVTS